MKRFQGWRAKEEGLSEGMERWKGEWRSHSPFWNSWTGIRTFCTQPILEGRKQSLCQGCSPSGPGWIYFVEFLIHLDKMR